MKLPTPKKLPSGRWRIQIVLDGKRHSITEDTKELCFAKALAYKTELIKQKKNAPPITLSKAIDNYIAAREAVLSPSTIRGYKNIQNKRFTLLMEKPLNSLNQTVLQRAVNTEAKLCSAKTLQNSWRFIASVIYEVTGERYDIKLPQVIPNERLFLSPEQIQTFLKAIYGSDIEIPALLGLWSLRRSEIIGLKWESVDIPARRITVENTIVPDEHHKLVEKRTTKNVSSRRVVPMVDRLAELLSTVPHISEFVVQENPETLRRKVNRICVANDLPQIGLHGLRHSFASLAYSLNVPEKIAMQIGGWSNDATMRKIYTHIAQSDLSSYTDKMTEFFNNSK